MGEDREGMRVTGSKGVTKISFNKIKKENFISNIYTINYRFQKLFKALLSVLMQSCPCFYA